MNDVVVDFEACTGCKTCYLACFADVIRWDAEAKRPVIAYPEDCVRCNVCEINCKDEAIKVAADWDMDYPPVIERGFPVYRGRQAMTALEELGRVESADILVIGGGVGGLAAATAAKEKNPDADVLVVERASTGWAGQANKGAGIWWYLAPEDDVDAFVKFHVEHIGHYIEDQDLLADFGRESLAILERVDGWTGRLQRREDGEIIHKRFKPFLPWSLTGMDLDFMRPLKRHARKLGVRFIDKTSLTDLLTDGGRVAGAVGFDLLDGSPIVIKAPAAIIATGGQSYRIMGMWSCQRGDGLGMAWRAGARDPQRRVGAVRPARRHPRQGAPHRF